MAVGSAVSYLMWPLPEDNGLHFAGVHQALVSGRGLLEIWNFRGPVYNAYLFLLYRFATLFVDFFDLRFDVMVRSAHLAILFGGCALWARGLGVRLALPAREALVVGALALFAMTSGWQTIPLHAEDVGMTVVLYGVGLAMLPGRGAHVVAAVLAGFLPFIKGITALYAVSVFAAGFVAGGGQRLVRLGLISGGAGGLGLGLIWLVAPVQITDLLETLHYQGEEWSISAKLVKAGKAVTYFVRNPLLLPSLIALLLHLGAIMRKRDRGELSFLMAIWGVPFVCLLLQGQYYTYHFAPVSLAAAYSLARVLTWEEACRTFDEAPAPWRRRFLILAGGIVVLGAASLVVSKLASLPAIVVSTALLALASFLNGNRPGRWPQLVRPSLLLIVAATIWCGAKRGAPSSSRLESAWAHVEDFRAKLGRRFERRVGKGSTVLLAAYGVSARHADVTSACRHFFAIPIQRNRGTQNFGALPGYKEAHRCFEEYRGRYVLWETNWLRAKQLKQTTVLRRYKVVERFTVRTRKYALLERVW